MALPIHWRLKLHAKLALSKFPIPYHFWKRLHLFEHGSMDQAAYAMGVFQEHFARVQVPPDWVGLELGPGDSAASALLARAHGASKLWLVDSGSYVNPNASVYRALATELKRNGQWAPPTIHFQEMLDACGATYLTNGLQSLSEVPSESVDFIWSQAVLEHIRLKDFLPTMKELRRILKPTGCMTHQIDFTDHLGGALNSLRFEEALWESEAWAKAGFYTNRLRFNQVIEALDSSGFQTKPLRIHRWDRLPTAQTCMQNPYRDFSEDLLRICDCLVVSR